MVAERRKPRRFRRQLLFKSGNEDLHCVLCDVDKTLPSLVHAFVHHPIPPPSLSPRLNAAIMKRVRSYPKSLHDAAASLHRDPTESMSEDDEQGDDDQLHDSIIQQATTPVAVVAKSKPRRRVTIREDLTAEFLNWQAPRTQEELEQCFIKVSPRFVISLHDFCASHSFIHSLSLIPQRTDKTLFRQDNADCIIRYRRRTVELGMDWNDACDHLLGSVVGLEEFQSPHTYHQRSKTRKTQLNAVLKRQAQLARRRPLLDSDAKWEALAKVAARYSHESVERALRLAQRTSYQSTASERPSLWMKLRSGLLK